LESKLHFVLGIWPRATKLIAMKKILYLMLAVTVLALVGGCSSDTGDMSSPPATNAPPAKAK
jgi:hypothetical protein